MRKIFITGCDKNTEWMLPWFIQKFRQHSELEIFLYDFGMSDEKLEWAKSRFDGVSRIALFKEAAGWFNKPYAMLDSVVKGESRVWLDTDCEIVGPIDDIFQHIKYGRLSICEDLPWTMRRTERWHNTGVVGLGGVPQLMTRWSKECESPHPELQDPNLPPIGDQDILHHILRTSLDRPIVMPNKYNVTRIQHLDKTVPTDARILHWTGHKGKEYIRESMKQS